MRSSRATVDDRASAYDAPVRAARRLMFRASRFSWSCVGPGRLHRLLSHPNRCERACLNNRYLTIRNDFAAMRGPARRAFCRSVTDAARALRKASPLASENLQRDGVIVTRSSADTRANAAFAQSRPAVARKLHREGIVIF
jgi:hypothetical protein